MYCAIAKVDSEVCTDMCRHAKFHFTVSPSFFVCEITEKYIFNIFAKYPTYGKSDEPSPRGVIPYGSTIFDCNVKNLEHLYPL